MEEQKSKKCLYKVIDMIKRKTMIEHATSADVVAAIGIRGINEVALYAREGFLFKGTYKIERESEPEGKESKNFSIELQNEWDEVVTRLRNSICWVHELDPGVRKISLKPNNKETKWMKTKQSKEEGHGTK